MRVYSVRYHRSAGIFAVLNIPAGHTQAYAIELKRQHERCAERTCLCARMRVNRMCVRLLLQMPTQTSISGVVRGRASGLLSGGSSRSSLLLSSMSAPSYVLREGLAVRGLDRTAKNKSFPPACVVCGGDAETRVGWGGIEGVVANNVSAAMAVIPEALYYTRAPIFSHD